MLVFDSNTSYLSLDDVSSVTLQILRLDQLYPQYSGNKAFKLRAVDVGQHRAILTFGGVWSNHLLAVSQFAHANGIASIGIVRSSVAISNALIDQCRRNGMDMRFVSYSDYRKRNSGAFLKALSDEFPNTLILPEGGSTPAAIMACKGIAEEISTYCDTPSHVVCAVGTGATLAGIRLGLPTSIAVEGEATTKKYHEQKALISQFCGDASVANWSLYATEGNGAYGQLKPDLLKFIVDFETVTGIKLDPNYSAKAFYGCIKRLQTGSYPAGSHIILVHTGGVVGRYGYPELIRQSPLR